jgi:CO/xanthine dehydrogenase FAD-binding subunit
VFAAVDATVILRSIDGQRSVPVISFYTEHRSTVMRPDELIVAAEVPRVDGGQWFQKRSQATSKIVVAGVRGPQPRFAIGGVAPTVMRAREAERILAESGDIDRAAGALERELTTSDEPRRRECVDLLRQFWSETSQ